MKDRVFLTLELETCSSLIEQNQCFRPWVIIRKPDLQCQIDAVTVIPGADALELWLFIGAYAVIRFHWLSHCLVFIKEEALLWYYHNNAYSFTKK
jgi:hypothetical protein